ncbi:MAG TPA: transglutaminase-like cysteine peptidase [Pseudomonas sp.]
MGDGASSGGAARSSLRPILAILLLALGLCSLASAWDFSLIGRRAEQLYGMQSSGRENLDAWQRLLHEQGSAGELEKLQAVNRFFNLRLRFHDDSELWHVRDYWATPVEALYKGAGDCEDFAIAKYFSLRHLGIPGEKLHITYVKAQALNQAHMVLTYYPHPKAIPLVLDNLIDAIEPADQRTDLIPVYAFNAEGLWSGNGRQVGDSKQLSRWQDLLRKMHAEGFP